jgi:hypothetical protein
VDDDHTAHLATDGISETYWQSQPNGEQWLAIDLGENQSLSRLTLHWGVAYPQKYRIEISSDGSRPTHWKTVFSTEEGRGNVEDIPLPSSKAQHVRLVGIADDAAKGISIAEFEVWGIRKQPLRSHSPLILSKSGELLTDGWRVQCARFLPDKPELLSDEAMDKSDWLEARVPGTVLASYLAAGAIPDPFYADQQTQISDEFFSRNDFWYSNSFQISPVTKGRRLWLVFEGINWKADIYLNGKSLGKVEGAFLRSRFEITDLARYGKANSLAVRVQQVAHPGPVHHKYLGSPTNNGDVLGLDSPTFVSSAGWNWLPTIRGRNTGIWNEVRFETSGDVLLADPWVTTELLSENNDYARLAARVEVRNCSDQPKSCSLLLAKEGSSFRKPITLQPHETRTVVLDSTEWAALAVKNLQLWWPNGYGDPTLHVMQFKLEADGQQSDEKTIHYGIRKIDYREDSGILTLHVNGHRILCRGGNWGMEDGMLTCDKAGYDLRALMHRDMNLVMIRNWVGMVGRGAFYDACDQHGLLIWDDFWLANPLNGPEPTDNDLFLQSVRDKILRVRRHPSLALYCGRNEGNPPPALDRAMRDAVSSLDGSRFYLPHSAAGLATGFGPYENYDPAWYFEHRGVTLHSEQGIVAVPPIESLRAMMPEENLWPINDMWAIHDYQTNRSFLNTERIAHRYGAPTDAEDYCRKAQMVNLETARAIYESLQSHQGSGTLIWMTQAAWPSLICQLYDYYFEQTAAYFGTKAACEPLHILWDQHSNLIKIANNTISPRANLRAEAWVYTLEGREYWHKSSEHSVQATSAQECFPLASAAENPPHFFLKLRLSEAGRTLSENFYWSSTQQGDCLCLLQLPRVRLALAAARGQNAHTVTATVTNPTSSVALAIRIKLMHSATGERVLPLMYEDNYFSLLPHESKTVTIHSPQFALEAKALRLAVEGWNIEQSETLFRDV